TSTLLPATDSDRDHFRLYRRLRSDLHIPLPAVFPSHHTFACIHKTYTVHNRVSRFGYRVHSLQVRQTYPPMKQRAPSCYSSPLYVDSWHSSLPPNADLPDRYATY